MGRTRPRCTCCWKARAQVRLAGCRCSRTSHRAAAAVGRLGVAQVEAVTAPIERRRPTSATPSTAREIVPGLRGDAPQIGEELEVASARCAWMSGYSGMRSGRRSPAHPTTRRRSCWCWCWIRGGRRGRRRVAAAGGEDEEDGESAHHFPILGCCAARNPSRLSDSISAMKSEVLISGGFLGRQLDGPALRSSRNRQGTVMPPTVATALPVHDAFHVFILSLVLAMRQPGYLPRRPTALPSLATRPVSASPASTA